MVAGIDVRFWEDWSAERQRQGLRLLVLAWVALWLGLFLIFSMMCDSEMSRIHSQERQFDKITPLVQDYLERQTVMGPLAALSPLAAAQQVTRELKLDDLLAAVRPMQIAGGQDGVQMLFQSVNLKQLLALLDSLTDRGGLKILSCNLNHRLDKPDHADVQLVLAR
ncbi:MAG: hypothetical protein AB7E47_10325 [Desulfovibrionaceae bacterium]